MKLNINFGPAIVTVLFLMGVVELRDNSYGDWLAEQGPVHYLVPPPPDPGDSVSIPGVYGYGAGALTGCFRDTVIVETVTSLAASGAGTLLDILTNSQHGDTLTIVTFDIGGWSAPMSGGGYEGKLECVYIAGQTAPGDGAGYRKFRMLRIRNDSYGFIVRGLTFTGFPGTTGSTPDISIENAQDFIFAENMHLWSAEKHITFNTVSTTDTVQNATMYRNLYAQPTSNEPTSIQVTQASTTATEVNRRITFARNLWHSSSHRNPLVSAANNPVGLATDVVPRARILGNLWYNIYQGVVQVRSRMVDILDSYVKSGPWTADGPSQDYSWAVAMDLTYAGDTVHSAYAERLIGIHNQDTTRAAADLWWDGTADTTFAEVSCYYRDCRDPAGGGNPLDSLPAAARRAAAMSGGDLPTLEFARINPNDLPDLLLGTGTADPGVGPYRHLKCDGTFEFRSDSMMIALLTEARAASGVGSAVDSTYVANRYGYTKSGGSTCDDADGDGIPDQYEDLMADLDKNTANDRSTDSDGDGWTAIEEYVNGTRSDTYTDSEGTEGAGVTTTYGNLRNAYLVPLDSVLDTIGFGPNTTILWRYIPDRDSVPLGYAYQYIRAAGRGSLIVLTYDTIAEVGAGELDSATVDTKAAELGITYPPYPWSVPITGIP